jgi:hypothetical protein
MKRIVVAFAAAALVAAALPSPAQAHCRGCGVGLGIFGGMVAGTIIGSAIAAPPPPPVYYGPPPPPPVYYDEPVGYAPGPGPACHIETMQVWDGYGYRPRQTQVCD